MIDQSKVNISNLESKVKAFAHVIIVTRRQLLSLKEKQNQIIFSLIDKEDQLELVSVITRCHSLQGLTKNFSNPTCRLRLDSRTLAIVS